MQSEATTTRPDTNDTESLYDRFANLYDLTFKVNRYGRSIERYFQTHPLPLPSGAKILDAGCGTGLLTLALLNVLDRPADITAIDLSNSSLHAARRAVGKTTRRLKHRVVFTQADVLHLPFADETFEFVITSGALEYVPLREGFNELARVIAPGGYLFHLPVRPSFVSKFILELLFRFKTHPPADVLENTRRHFHILDEHHFQPAEPIGWTKLALLSQKK